MLNPIPDALASAVSDLANDLRPAVAQIEAEPQTTRNHYGKYLGILSMCKDPQSRAVLLAALIEAGANLQGVRDAYKLC